MGHYWWKQSFPVFGTGCDRLSARLETAKNVLSYPSRHTLPQHPQSTPHSGCHGVTEVAKTANIAKMAHLASVGPPGLPGPPELGPSSDPPVHGSAQTAWCSPLLRPGARRP